MLMILSEINCLDYLRSRDVYPDEFFTDLSLFKHRIVMNTDVDVLIIFAGSCSFGKRVVQEYVNELNKRMKDETDKGIKSICVLSDTVLPSLDNYYKYTRRPDSCSKCSHWNISKGVVDILGKYKCAEKNTEVYLCDSDMSNTGDILLASRDKDDELLSIIQVPSFSS